MCHCNVFAPKLMPEVGESLWLKRHHTNCLHMRSHQVGAQFTGLAVAEEASHKVPPLIRLQSDYPLCFLRVQLQCDHAPCLLHGSELLEPISVDHGHCNGITPKSMLEVD